jgi:hypothetical protein
LAPLPQHLHQHRSERPVLLAVDQQFGEGAALGLAPELANPVRAFGVGNIRTWRPLKAAESDADTSCLRGYFDLRRRDR